MAGAAAVEQDPPGVVDSIDIYSYIQPYIDPSSHFLRIYSRRIQTSTVLRA